MNIHPSDLVLEVGSGNNPNPRSDILLDRYLFDNGQRAGEFRIVVDRPLVVGDGYHLPFKNKTFDYVICSHILEHMEDPKAFMREMTRVGKAGYIEVPSDVSERIFGWNFHRWYCKLNGKTLVLTKKKEGERFGGFYHRLIAKKIWFRRFFEDHETRMYTRLEWRTNVRLRIISKVPTKYQLALLDQEARELLSASRQDIPKDLLFGAQFLFRRIKRKMRKVWRKINWIMQTILKKEHQIQSIMRYCMCPRCRGSLFRKSEGIQCRKCRTDYPLIGVISVLLTKNEQVKGY